MGDVAYILYGRGGSLGNFALFARTLENDLKARFEAGDIVTLSVETRAGFFDALENPSFRGAKKIRELHVFSHSIGGGLFLKYGDRAAAAARVAALQRAQNRGSRLTYDEVIFNEPSVVFTDNLIRRPWGPKRVTIRENFTVAAEIKLWGCNARVTGWVYTDKVNGSWVSAPSIGSIKTFYWRALNQQNMPKPSISQALADYFKRTTLGAESGSHIEVLGGSGWIDTRSYEIRHGVKPSGALPHMLVPDHGVYRECHPTGRP